MPTALALGTLEGFTGEVVVVTFFGNFGLQCCFVADLYIKVEVGLDEVSLRNCLSLDLETLWMASSMPCSILSAEQ